MLLNQKLVKGHAAYGCTYEDIHHIYKNITGIFACQAKRTKAQTYVLNVETVDKEKKMTFAASGDVLAWMISYLRCLATTTTTNFDKGQRTLTSTAVEMFGFL